MAKFDETLISDDAKAVLQLLKDRHNVLISGPPATGKSRLLAELRYWFKSSTKPAMVPQNRVPLPAGATVRSTDDWLPSPDRTRRRIFSITFHQGTKYRDFVTGLSPRVAGGASAFVVTRGPLYEAAQHGRTPDGAALVEIDEINRGPAVTVFGDTITAIEGDKRTNPDGTDGPTTTTFKVMKEDGTFEDYALPYHLYIVAAMNEADTSVEPLDVAFLRRFVKYRLLADESCLRRYFDLQDTRAELPNAPLTATDVYEAAVRAWAAVNDKIELARGSAFQLGHGIFMGKPKDEVPADLPGALRQVNEAWAQIYSHVEEVFFGDTRGLAAILRAGETGSPYSLAEEYFAETPLVRLRGPKVVGPENVYPILLSVAGG